MVHEIGVHTAIFQRAYVFVFRIICIKRRERAISLLLVTQILIKPSYTEKEMETPTNDKI